MPCFIAPLNLLSHPTAAPRAELGPPLMAGDTGSDVRPARLNCSVTVTLSESRHLWVCSSPARRGAGASPQGGPECQTGPGGNAKHRGRHRAGVSQRTALNVDVTVTDGRTSGLRGLPEGLPCMPGAVLVTCPRQIWGSGSRAESGVLCTAEANSGGLEVDALPHWPR